MQYLLSTSILITLALAKDGPARQDAHNHFHQKRASTPSGYTKLSSDGAKLPSFDDCINYQILDTSLSSSYTQGCANICSEDSSCNFFAVWNTPSASVSPYCGWWTNTFKTTDITQTSTDNNEAISNAMVFNKVPAPSTPGSTKASSTSTKSIAPAPSSVKTTSTGTKTSISSIRSTSSTTSRKISSTTSPAKVTNASSKTSVGTITSAPSSTLTPSSTSAEVETVLTSSTMLDFKFAYAFATGIPPQSDGHMINFFHSMGDVSGCADQCARTAGCKFFTSWWATGIDYGKYGKIDVIDCAIFDKVYTISEGTVTQFDSGGVRNSIGYALNRPTIPGYNLAYDTAAAIPPQDGWHMLNWYHNLDGYSTNQTYSTCAQYCSQTSGCVFWTVWLLWPDSGLMNDCAIYNKVFTSAQANVSQWDGQDVLNAVGYSKK